MKIKICGLTDVREAEYLNRNHVDYAGIILFYGRSRRNMTLEGARPILEALSPEVKKVAVMVSPTLEQVSQAAEAGFGYVQIHGELAEEVLQGSRLPILRAINVDNMDQYEYYQGCPQIAGYVFDAKEPGSGMTFDWRLLQGLPRDNKLFLLAGGLNPENVARAIQTVGPDGVDVSSGVEYRNGKGKDPAAIEKFVRRARGMTKELQIKMVVLNLDAILRSDNTISSYVKSMLEGLPRQGIQVVVVTSRTMRETNRFGLELATTATIYRDGVIICEEDNLYNLGIDHPFEIFSQILAKYPSTRLAAEKDGVLYANFNTRTIWPELSHGFTKTFAELRRYEQAERLLIGISDLREMERLEAFMPADSDIHFIGNGMAEVKNRKATRVGAVGFIAGKYGIQAENMVVFGADEQDMALFSKCGASIAVENAPQGVRAAADEICASHDADGPARWLADNLRIQL